MYEIYINISTGRRAQPKRLPKLLITVADEILQYLEQFNYIPKQTGASAMLSSTVIEEALKRLQRYGRIPATGQLDSETIKLMARKSWRCKCCCRCGLGDQQPHRHRRHKKRFALGSVWHKNFLTYRSVTLCSAQHFFCYSSILFLNLLYII
ncbi:unnamed protein product [Enterobius vermicularis]|uniref:PG_binding_1 domain-containing protein n=1 Tax=Enterobius vermicularis TaxID=51028 RepID=A0A0N4VEF1_ENTVE|nr:unnamed protein product [Enterobius vermicularis]